MNIDQIVNKINNMTFRELRNELAYCDDPTKEKIIRNIMYRRYTQYMKSNETQTKNQISRNKNDSNIVSEVINKQTDDRKITEYNRDRVNKHLNARLNNDIDIKTDKNHT